MDSFEVRIGAAAEDEFRRVPFPFRRQINQRILRLKHDPFPPDCIQQEGLGFCVWPIYGWRILYRVDAAARTVTIFHIHQ